MSLQEGDQDVHIEGDNDSADSQKNRGKKVLKVEDWLEHYVV